MKSVRNKLRKFRYSYDSGIHNPKVSEIAWTRICNPVVNQSVGSAKSLINQELRICLSVKFIENV